MFNQYTRIIDTYKTLVGKMAGANYQFTVGRPPYIQGDNSPVIITTTFSAQVEPVGPNWAVDKIPDAEFYVVCGDPSTFEEGDQLWGAQELPRVTVFSKVDGQEFLAIKTDKPCHIEDMNEPLYTGLYFDYMNSTSAGPDELHNDPTALNNPVRRVITYKIPGVTEGMKFWDDQIDWVWDISKVDFKLNLMTLFLENPNRV